MGSRRQRALEAHDSFNRVPEKVPARTTQWLGNRTDLDEAPDARLPAHVILEELDDNRAELRLSWLNRRADDPWEALEVVKRFNEAFPGLLVESNLRVAVTPRVGGRVVESTSV